MSPLGVLKVIKVITATDRPCVGRADGRRAEQTTAPVVICVNVRSVRERARVCKKKKKREDLNVCVDNLDELFGMTDNLTA